MARKEAEKKIAEEKKVVEKEVKEKKPKRSWIRGRSSKKVKEVEPQQHYESLPFEGLAYKTHLTDKYRNRTKYNPHEFGTVYSMIPGTIKSIAVKLEQEVKKGELLCILDAMKMNNEILSPCDGLVTEIHVKPNQILAKDVLLFKIVGEMLNEDEDVEDDSSSENDVF